MCVTLVLHTARTLPHHVKCKLTAQRTETGRALVGFAEMTLQVMASVSWLGQHKPGLEASSFRTTSKLHFARVRAAWDPTVILTLLGSSAQMGAW